MKQLHDLVYKVVRIGFVVDGIGDGLVEDLWRSRKMGRKRCVGGGPDTHTTLTPGKRPTQTHLDNVGAVRRRHKVKGQSVLLGKAKGLLCYAVVHVNFVGHDNDGNVGAVFSQLLRWGEERGDLLFEAKTRLGESVNGGRPTRTLYHCNRFLYVTFRVTSKTRMQACASW